MAAVLYWTFSGDYVGIELTRLSVIDSESALAIRVFVLGFMWCLWVCIKTISSACLLVILE